MSKIVSVYNQKGGCGKTTTAINLSVYAALNGLRVYLADIDPQESASSWAAQASRDEPFPAMFESMSVLGDKFDIKIELLAKSNMYDLIVIDCPPAINSKLAQTALMISDAVVIPTILSPLDMQATDTGFELIDMVRRVNRSLKLMQLKTKVQRSNVSKAIADVQYNFCIENGIIPLENQFSQRTCYSETVFYGKGIAQMKSSEVPKEAIDETDAVCSEILSHVFSDDQSIAS